MIQKVTQIIFFVYFLTNLTPGCESEDQPRCKNGQLKHPNITNCKTNEDCPNMFGCRKLRKTSECCQQRVLKNCEPFMEDKYVPRLCNRGNSVSGCPEGYTCNAARKNRYTVCCKDVTCVDTSGKVHKTDDPEWLDAEDKCNVCKCLPTGQIECSDKPECRKNIAKCLKPCEGKTGPSSGYSPCVGRGCSVQAKVRPCLNSSTNQSICLDYDIKFKRCNEEKCPRPGRNLKERSESDRQRILGGTEVFPRHNWPWLVSLYELGCGASVLSPIHILTAGHCVKDRPIITLLTGKHNIYKIEILEQVRVIRQGPGRIRNATNTSQVFIHENYTIWDNDIAILKIHPPLVLDRWTQPVLLPKDGSDETFNQGTSGQGVRCMLAGWGQVNLTEGSDSPRLLELELNVQSECDLPPEDLIDVTDNAFCAAKNETSAVCFGDSGGPFMCSQDDKTWVQYGIISWGLRFCERSTVYMKTTKYLDWIKDTIATDGGWGEYSSWSKCHPCPRGTMSRVRVCTKPEPIGNGSCPGGTGLVYRDKHTGHIVDLVTVACTCQK